VVLIFNDIQNTLGLRIQSFSNQIQSFSNRIHDQRSTQRSISGAHSSSTTSCAKQTAGTSKDSIPIEMISAFIRPVERRPAAGKKQKADIAAKLQQSRRRQDAKEAVVAWRREQERILVMEYQ
jgi:hypothetical protein